MNGNVDDLIDKKIDNIIKENNIYHTGKVTKINNFIIEATGLEEVFFFEKVYVKDEENVGYIDKITEDKVVIALVKMNGNIRVGDPITASGEVLQVSFSKNSIGMVIDPFGNDKMSGKKFNDSKLINIETPNIPIMDRSAVNRPLETGIAAIDLMYPIGKGQRQLIIGDKKTGKTQICLDTIVNQKGKNVICIYVAIGKTKKDLKRLYTKLTEKQTNSYTHIVATFNDDPVPLLKLTPYVAISIAQEYMNEGYDVLVCIDDLRKHADACREIALISEKNTGRDAYPADIFYIHSRMLEKGCQHRCGGSITILPIVETKAGDITDYISTNIISITDGQIVLSEKLFKKGQKPAIDFGLSVSRLGGAVQTDEVKKIGSTVRRELLSFLETSDVYQLVNIESLSEELQGKIFKGQKLLNLLNQPKYSPFSEEKLIDTFGYVVGLGHSSAVNALLKDIELTQRIEDDGTNNNPPSPPPSSSTTQTTPPPVNESQAASNTQALSSGVVEQTSNPIIQESTISQPQVPTQIVETPVNQPTNAPVVEQKVSSTPLTNNNDGNGDSNEENKEDHTIEELMNDDEIEFNFL